MNLSITRINLGFVNAYLIPAGDGFILVDTGVSDVWNRLETELINLKCLPSKIKLVVLTHGDSDHCGNCRTLQEKYGIKIAIHEGDLDMIRSGKAPARHASSLFGKILLKLGSRMAPQPAGFEPDIYLHNGQTLESFGSTTRIIHTPGHTAGSIVLLTEDGSLIVGDTFLNRRKPKPAELIHDDVALQKSLAEIRKLKAEMVYPGHGDPFSFQKLLDISPQV